MLTTTGMTQRTGIREVVLGLIVVAFAAGSMVLLPTPPPAEKTPEAGPAAPGDVRLSQAAARADVRQLAQLLAAAHPDPYLRGGGRVAFHRRVQRALASIGPEGVAVRQLLGLLRPVVASVQDGHTTIGLPRQRRLSLPHTRIDFEVIDDQLRVRRVYDESQRFALGAALESVAGVAVGDLVERMKDLRGYDNSVSNWVHLASALGAPDLVAALLQVEQAPDPLALAVTLADGATRTLSLPWTTTPPGDPLAASSRIELPTANAAGLAWGLMGDGDDIAYLRIDSMMRYREAFEAWRATGYTQNLGEHLTNVARAALGSEPPAGVDERIAAVPSATELMQSLVAAAARANAHTLVVDLRDNSGGNSYITFIVLYALFGYEVLRDAEWGYQIPRYSSLYFDNYQTATIERVSEGQDLAIGDFDFTDEAAWRRVMQHGLSEDERGRRERDLDSAAARSTTFGSWLAQRAGAPTWKPRLVVLTAARTYSAGFDLAAMLFKQGAAIVGVASSQAGNCFIDSLGYHLDHSGLGGSISYKHSLLFPEDPKLGRVLRPDVPLTAKAFRRLGSDPNATVLLALEWIAEQRRARTTAAQPVGELVWHGELDGALALLKDRYGLASVIEGAETELDQLMAIRNWVHGRWEHDCCNIPERFDSLSILQAAERGERFRCVEYAITLADAYRALGWCARFVRLQGRGAHAVTEVYARDHDGWVLMDGQHAAHVSRGGVPLSARAIQQALAAGATDLVAHVDGPPVDYLAWLAPMLDYVMVPLENSYGRQLDTLVVLPPPAGELPRSKPRYLRNTTYRLASGPALLDKSCPLPVR